jgi:hypothetical protein
MRPFLPHFQLRLFAAARYADAAMPVSRPSPKNGDFLKNSPYLIAVYRFTRIDRGAVGYSLRSGRSAKSKKTYYSARPATENKYRTTNRSRGLRESNGSAAPGIPYVSGE